MSEELKATIMAEFNTIKKELKSNWLKILIGILIVYGSIQGAMIVLNPKIVERHVKNIVQEADLPASIESLEKSSLSRYAYKVSLKLPLKTIRIHLSMDEYASMTKEYSALNLKKIEAEISTVELNNGIRIKCLTGLKKDSKILVKFPVQVSSEKNPLFIHCIQTRE